MKRPAFQFYPGDWRRDAALQSCSIGARGLWVEMMCLMHEGCPYGHLKVGEKDILAPILARMVGISLPEVEGYLGDLEEAGVFSRTSTGTIYSRRMVQDEELRQRRAAGGVKSLDHPNVPQPKDILQGYPSPLSSDGSSGGSPASASASASALHSRDPNRKNSTGSRRSSGPAPPQGGWPAEWAKDYESIGLLSPGQIGKVCKPVLDRYGPADAREMWQAYILARPHMIRGEFDPDHHDVNFMGPADFVKTAGVWFERIQPVTANNGKP